MFNYKFLTSKNIFELMLNLKVGGEYKELAIVIVSVEIEITQITL